MPIPFYRGGFTLPVAQPLLALLSQEVAKKSLDLARLTELTFSFRGQNRDSGHSAGQGVAPNMPALPLPLTKARNNIPSPAHSAGKSDVRPVEIRLIRGLDGWLFDYVTDFSQGPAPETERCTETDFNFLDDEHYLQGWGPMQRAEARVLFEQWQSDFIAYSRLDYFTVTVTGN